MRLTTIVLSFLFITIVLSSPIRFAYAQGGHSATVPKAELQMRTSLRDARASQFASLISDAVRSIISSSGNVFAQYLHAVTSVLAQGWSQARAIIVATVNIKASTPATTPLALEATANAPPVINSSVAAVPRAH